MANLDEYAGEKGPYLGLAALQDVGSELAHLWRRPDVVTLLDRHVERFKMADRADFIEALEKQRPMLNQVLLVTYLKSERTASGLIIRTDKLQDEDKWQGKVGLVVALGSLAFINDGDDHPKVGDYVVFRASDGLPVEVNKGHCRLLDDDKILAVTSDPDSIDMRF